MLIEFPPPIDCVQPRASLSRRQDVKNAHTKGYAFLFKGEKKQKFNYLSNDDTSLLVLFLRSENVLSSSLKKEKERPFLSLLFDWVGLRIITTSYPVTGNDCLNELVLLSV